MDNFNNENNIMPEATGFPNTAPASVLDGDEATDETPAMAGQPPVEPGLKLAQEESQPVQPMGGMPQQSQPVQPMGGMPQQSQPVQPMGGMPQQPQFGQPQMGGMPQQPQFGQPQMGGMPQQPQFGQPMGMNQQPYGQPPMGGGQPTKPKKVKKPLSKGAIGGIIGGGVALIALIVCAIIFLPKLFPTDKEVVVDAFEATFGIETEAETEDFLGAKEIADKFATTGGVREFSVEMSADSMGEVTSVNAGFVESIDVANKLANSTWTIGMNGKNFLNVNLVIDETNTYLQVPEMISGYFSLPNENIFQALENSELGQAMGITGMPEFNMADMYFNLATSGTATELNGEYVAIVEKLWDSITYEKQGKAKVDVNGKTITTKEYFITVPQDAMKEAVGDLWDAAVAELAANPEYLAQMGMDAATFESTMSSYSGVLTSLIQGDLVIKVYIADDKIVKLVCADEVAIYGASISYDMYLDIDDEAVSGVFDFTAMDETVGLKFNVTGLDSNPNGKITVYAAGETIDVNFNGTASDTSCDVTYDVVYNGTTYVDGTVKTNVDEANHSFNGNASVNIVDAGTIDMNFEGGFKDINKGVGYTFELSKCEFLADGEPMMNMTSKIRIDTSTHTATGIDTSLPVYDVTTLTEADFEQILSDNTALVEAWLDANSDLFGSYEEPIVEEPVEVVEPEVDDMILEGSAKSVEILGTIDGFTLDDVSDWYITYSTEEWSYLEYSIYENFTVEECLDYIYIPEEGVITQELNQTMDLDGETIHYSYVQYDDFGYKYSSYIFVKDLGDGVFLVLTAGIYDDDDSFTKEQLVQALSNQYYQIVQ
ncbi:MAG: hypothetical protein IKJ73_01970 [Lachnospiraceae bacterium]|nr:hypothetical protein [Lachnospiraceae bacterium]